MKGRYLPAWRVLEGPLDPEFAERGRGADRLDSARAAGRPPDAARLRRARHRIPRTGARPGHPRDLPAAAGVGEGGEAALCLALGTLVLTAGAIAGPMWTAVLAASAVAAAFALSVDGVRPARPADRSALSGDRGDRRLLRLFDAAALADRTPAAMDPKGVRELRLAEAGQRAGRTSGASSAPRRTARPQLRLHRPGGLHRAGRAAAAGGDRADPERIPGRDDPHRLRARRHGGQDHRRRRARDVRAPIADPRHAERAVGCALDLDRFAEAFAAEKRQGGIPFGRTRIGVNSGSAIVGNFGGELRFDYTAHGDAINTAARLEGANKYLGTRICVSEETARRCPSFTGRPAGTVLLKGSGGDPPGSRSTRESRRPPTRTPTRWRSGCWSRVIRPPSRRSRACSPAGRRTRSPPSTCTGCAPAPSAASSSSPRNRPAVQNGSAGATRGSHLAPAAQHAHDHLLARIGGDRLVAPVGRPHTRPAGGGSSRSVPQVVDLDQIALVMAVADADHHRRQIEVLGVGVVGHQQAHPVRLLGDAQVDRPHVPARARTGLRVGIARPLEPVGRVAAAFPRQEAVAQAQMHTVDEHRPIDDAAIDADVDRARGLAAMNLLFAGIDDRPVARRQRHRKSAVAAADGGLPLLPASPPAPVHMPQPRAR